MVSLFSILLYTIVQNSMQVVSRSESHSYLIAVGTLLHMTKQCSSEILLTNSINIIEYYNVYSKSTVAPVAQT